MARYQTIGTKSAASVAVLFFALLAGCATYVGDDFVRGRQALLRNQPQEALAYFMEVARQNPDYVYHSMNFSEGIWTYVGRSQYQLGRYQEARESLERALAQNPEDHMARLYLGLAQLRSGDPKNGTAHVTAGMRGLHEWIEYMERTQSMQAYWDPAREIRRAIENELSAIKAERVDREDLIASAEWLGKEMEEEIDRARRDERRRYEQDGDDGRRAERVRR